jgi:methylated-DNA-protein-cysteine methyltransferase-like protein
MARMQSRGAAADRDDARVQKDDAVNDEPSGAPALRGGAITTRWICGLRGRRPGSQAGPPGRARSAGRILHHPTNQDCDLTLTKNPASAFVPAFTWSYNSDVAHSVHEMANINTLLAGVTNTIRFQRVSGSGTLGVSDVVLWYKRNVTTANLLITHRPRKFGYCPQPAMDEQTVERVRDVVAAIPLGRVMAYGEVAARAGLPGRARLVGRILAEDGLPWHRVLRADGSPAPHLADEQLARLRAEGVLAEGRRIPMRRYRAPD